MHRIKSNLQRHAGAFTFRSKPTECNLQEVTVSPGGKNKKITVVSQKEVSLFSFCLKVMDVENKRRMYPKNTWLSL